jgi:hypothetical protein
MKPSSRWQQQRLQSMLYSTSWWRISFYSVWRDLASRRRRGQVIVDLFYLGCLFYPLEVSDVIVNNPKKEGNYYCTVLLRRIVCTANTPRGFHIHASTLQDLGLPLSARRYSSTVLYSTVRVLQYCTSLLRLVFFNASQTYDGRWHLSVLTYSISVTPSNTSGLSIHQAMTLGSTLDNDGWAGSGGSAWKFICEGILNCLCVFGLAQLAACFFVHWWSVVAFRRFSTHHQNEQTWWHGLKLAADASRVSRSSSLIHYSTRVPRRLCSLPTLEK